MFTLGVNVAFRAKLGLVVMPAERELLVQTATFYSRMFGIQFARTVTDLVKVLYAPISIDGTMFSVEWRELLPGEQRVPFPVFIVDSLDQAEKELVELGGQLLGERFILPIGDKVMPEHIKAMLELGRHESQITDKVGVMRRMTDPNGTMLCLLELDGDSEYWFKTGPYRIGLTVDQMVQWQKEIELADRVGLDPI